MGIEPMSVVDIANSAVPKQNPSLFLETLGARETLSFRFQKVVTSVLQSHKFKHLRLC